MKLKPQYIYLIAGTIICLICGFTFYNFYQKNSEPYAPSYPNQQVPNTAEISSMEIRAFLKTWIKYQEKYGSCPQIPELSYDTSDGKTQLDSDLTKWLLRHGWNVNRFVHIESRLRVIINTIQKDKAIMEKQKLIVDGAANTTDPALVQTLYRAADIQRKSLNIEQISATERHLIEPQLATIANLLKCQDIQASSSSLIN